MPAANLAADTFLPGALVDHAENLRIALSEYGSPQMTWPSQSTAYEDVPTGHCFKTELNTHCQRVLRRSVSKSDITYNVKEVGDFYQATVELPCIDGLDFAGVLSGSPKDASQSVAEIALDFLVNKYDGPIAIRDKPGLREIERFADADFQPEEFGGANQSLTPKALLNTLCTSVARRCLAKGHTVYTVMQTSGGFQATVRLTSLPSKWQRGHWVGKVCATRREAEQSCAQAALNGLTACKEILELVHRARDGGAPQMVTT